MDWADDIAYAVHDLEDGIHVGLITTGRAQALREDILARAQRAEPSADDADVDWAVSKLDLMGDPLLSAKPAKATRKEISSELIGDFISSTTREPPGGTTSAIHSVRYDSRVVVSASAKRRVAVLKALTFSLMINDARVHTLEARSERILKDLFDFHSKPDALRAYPDDFRPDFRMAGGDSERRARVACDFLSGMTDQYAERLHQRLFSSGRVALLDY